MKLVHLLSIVIFCALMPLSSCTDSKKEARAEEARKTLPVAPPPSTTATNTDNSPLINSSTTSAVNPEPHYKCPNNDGGIGTAKSPCPVCGTEMAHNQAFHNQSNNTATTPPPATTPESAQNAAGVWHYICEKGCAGGAGGAGNCATCGGTLTHNTAYH